MIKEEAIKYIDSNALLKLEFMYVLAGDEIYKSLEDASESLLETLHNPEELEKAYDFFRTGFLFVPANLNEELYFMTRKLYNYAYSLKIREASRLLIMDCLDNYMVFLDQVIDIIENKKQIPVFNDNVYDMLFKEKLHIIYKELRRNPGAGYLKERANTLAEAFTLKCQKNMPLNIYTRNDTFSSFCRNVFTSMHKKRNKAKRNRKNPESSVFSKTEDVSLPIIGGNIIKIEFPEDKSLI